MHLPRKLRPIQLSKVLVEVRSYLTAQPGASAEPMTVVIMAPEQIWESIELKQMSDAAAHYISAHIAYLSLTESERENTAPVLRAWQLLLDLRHEVLTY